MLYTGLDLHRSFSYITTMNDKGDIEQAAPALPGKPGEGTDWDKEQYQSRIQRFIW